MPAGAVHDSVTCPLPALVDTPVGAPGGVVALTCADAGPAPPAFSARTRK